MYITQIPSDLQAVHTSHLHVTYHVVSQEEHTTDGLHWLSVHQLQLLVALICQILTLTCLVDVAQGYFVIRFPMCVDVLNRFFLKIRKKHKYHFISYDTIICPGRAHVHWWFSDLLIVMKSREQRFQRHVFIGLISANQSCRNIWLTRIANCFTAGSLGCFLRNASLYTSRFVLIRHFKTIAIQKWYLFIIQYKWPLFSGLKIWLNSSIFTLRYSIFVML